MEDGEAQGRRQHHIAGVVAGVVAMGLFAYRYYSAHVWSWDLLAVGVTMAAVKWALMLWFHWTD